MPPKPIQLERMGSPHIGLLLGIGLVLTLGAPSWVLAKLPVQGPVSGPCCRREFWVVNTRCAPLCRGLDKGVHKITYWKWVDGNLVQKSLDQFVDGVDPSLTTTVYVHGNTVNSGLALRIANRVMDTVGSDVPNYRMILWSWPSEHRWGLGFRGNVLAKARWSESQGYYLAWLVDKVNPRTTLSLVGHSFGSRAVAAGLQALATNRIAGYDLGKRQHAQWRPMQAALVAAAFDNRWLWPEQRYGKAISQIDHLLVTRNPDDRLLQFYSDKFLPAGVRAIGLTGIPDRQRLGDMEDRVTRVYPIWAGTSHRWSRYANNPEAARRLRPHFFYENPLSFDLLFDDTSPPIPFDAELDDDPPRLPAP